VNDLADRGGRLVVREVEDQPVIVVVGAAADRIDEGGRIGIGAQAGARHHQPDEGRSTARQVPRGAVGHVSHRGGNPLHPVADVDANAGSAVHHARSSGR
jgi:hypothetical protein